MVVHTPLMLTWRRERQVDLWEFKASLVYILSSGTARHTQRDPVSNNKNLCTEKQPHTQSCK